MDGEHDMEGNTSNSEDPAMDGKRIQGLLRDRPIIEGRITLLNGPFYRGIRRTAWQLRL